MQKRNSDKLVRAIKSFKDALDYTRSAEFQGLDSSVKSVLHAAVVQNFSLTFNVCQKMLRYKLADVVGDKVAKIDSEESLLRLAAEERLISNLDNWLEYLECEYLTQTSNSTVRTFEKAASFLQDANEILSTCPNRINNERRRAA
ncbi:MAG: nucleotidyltransferase substrate binding protein [Planctomycetaceae bacterium]|jgi:hypothetical protein|nr:nucleotidyltransferase substrate binding protein [Planctomycetaceae bacterium]